MSDAPSDWDFDAIQLEELRRRSGRKWGHIEKDLIPAWIADMDFEPAPAIRAAIESLVETGDLGYPPEPTKNGLADIFCKRMALRFDWQTHPDEVRLATDVVQAVETVILLYNAGSGRFGTISEVSPEQFENMWRVNAYGAFLSAKAVAPDMIARGHGSMLFTGATAGVKAGARSVAFGPAKFALRGLVQSLARDLGPQGIHVAWVNVDGVIDIPGRDMPQFMAEDMLKPEAIAETYWHLAHQDRSAWTTELEVRPFKEKF